MVAEPISMTADLDLVLPSPVVELADERLAVRDVRLFLKRDDLIHPELPGNKWRKLKYNLVAAAASGQRTLLTFGGAYSNHIRAVAAAGRIFGFKTIGIIRGEEHLPLNPTLAYAREQGMTLSYLDRTTYREKHSPAVLDSLRRRFGDFFLVPEGGSNAAAVRGVAELAAELTIPYDVICCACGTGATLAGLAAGLPPGPRAIGFSVLKGAAFSSTMFGGSNGSTAGKPRTGRSSWAFTSAASPVGPRRSTTSSATSANATASSWTGSTWRR